MDARSQRPGFVAFAALSLLVPILVVNAPPASADTMTVMSAKFPLGRERTSAVWDGQHAYIFGGLTTGGPTWLRDIVRYDPAADTLTLMTALLPSARYGTSAVWDDVRNVAYVFGGRISSGSVLSQIVKYDPATDTATVLSPTIPSGSLGAAAAWDGQYAYIFGGYTNTFTFTSRILRFDPATNTITTMAATVPSGIEHGGAAFDGRYIYVSAPGSIVRYDPATDKTTTVKTNTGTSGRAGAVWTGSDLVLFSGDPGNRIKRYRPDTGALAFSDANLPTILYWTSAVWTGSAAYVFGGYDGTNFRRSNEVLRFVDPCDPPVTTATLDGTLGDAGWWRSAVDVTLTATGECPIVATYRALDGGPFEAGTTLEIAGDGVHDLAFFSTDSQGNSEAPNHVEVKIDATPPEAAILRPVARRAYVLDHEDPLPDPSLPLTLVAGDVAVAANAFDATSGVARVEVVVDGVVRASLTEAPYDWVWTAGREALGDHGLSAIAYDVAGNAAETATLAVTTIPTSRQGAEATLGGGPPDEGGGAREPPDAADRFEM